MERFDDTIGYGSVGRDVFGFNACVIKQRLEVGSIEFRSMIMDDARWARVAREPEIFEEVSDVFCCFGAWDTNYFNEVGNWVNACESVKAEFDFVDFNIPWADAIEVHFRP